MVEVITKDRSIAKDRHRTTHKPVSAKQASQMSRTSDTSMWLVWSKYVKQHIVLIIIVARERERE